LWSCDSYENDVGPCGRRFCAGATGGGGNGSAAESTLKRELRAGRPPKGGTPNICVWRVGGVEYHAGVFREQEYDVMEAQTMSAPVAVTATAVAQAVPTLAMPMEPVKPVFKTLSILIPVYNEER